MIDLINSIDMIDSSKFGNKITSLFYLKKARMNIIDSIIISNDVFKLFKEEFTLPNSILNKIFELLNGFTSDLIFIQTSFVVKCDGIYTQIKIEKDLMRIKYWIEKIYRSWFDDTARTYRILNLINDENTFPAILIQPYITIINSLITRNPKSGERLNEHNMLGLIDIKIQYFKKEYKEVIDQVENVIKIPSKIYFEEENGILRICCVKVQMMTTICLIEFLFEYYAENKISAEYIIQYLTPEMIEYTEGIEAIPQDIISSNCLCKSYGYCYGKLVFRNSIIKKHTHDQYILLFHSFIPDDLKLMKKCSAILSVTGGMTSHDAVISRGLGIPALGLRNCNIKILETKKKLLCDDKTITEFTDVFIDAYKGVLSLSASFEKHYKLKISNEILFEKIKDLLAQFDDLAKLKKLSIDMQKKIASLKYSIRRIGI